MSLNIVSAQKFSSFGFDFDLSSLLDRTLLDFLGASFFLLLATLGSDEDFLASLRTSNSAERESISFLSFSMMLSLSFSSMKAMILLTRTSRARYNKVESPSPSTPVRLGSAGSKASSARAVQRSQPRARVNLTKKIKRLVWQHPLTNHVHGSIELWQKWHLRSRAAHTGPPAEHG
jgi:hypothetical protein